MTNTEFNKALEALSQQLLILTANSSSGYYRLYYNLVEARMLEPYVSNIIGTTLEVIVNKYTSKLRTALYTRHSSKQEMSL